MNEKERQQMLALFEVMTNHMSPEQLASALEEWELVSSQFVDGWPAPATSFAKPDLYRVEPDDPSDSWKR